ncbi:DarT ssDNA thymidine ADP-ribosyltransferase family protein [Oscillatoria sp. FACHB-1406]|uniref:DarT ssDNA thymidine ADP-ribosyltransferase family protein n=1 Tax=Oscillatoria sp. FACHB-1406 TaxID=2692846 RepID=UPI0016851853|nr:DarT ssDNA thymidine ADP-ribosyltransferase family protein [Oscillatoria sp. FACHB-1406]MBD2579284.1 DUF4433 domain-containing protein [Oscillatoria sp. FACHB-1406]
MKKPNIISLYYITHIENLPSILDRGILSHESVENQGIAYTSIYDREIVSRRREKSTPERNSLWEYANLYFQPRNPMMYRMICETDRRNIAVVGIKPAILKAKGVTLTDGNAANDATQFYPAQQGLEVLHKQRKILEGEWWTEVDGSKRKIMAECLVPERIDSDLIHSIFVTDHKAKERVQSKIGFRNVPIVPEPHMFFQPRSATRIGRNISLIDGDMFFSNMQTLTISVNLQGVMGKGLASRAKYQFPDVYVVYQDACKNRQIDVDTPYLYQREASLDRELADLTIPLEVQNSVKWFLFFVTKRNWRENSRLEDIESGLAWLQKKSVEVGIQSLAMPALGCGLGNLSWREVGPVMCRYLHNIGIPVAIYLPREHEIDPMYLTQEFLLEL